MDVCEYAEAVLLRREGAEALDPLRRDDDHLAGLDVADETRADDVEGAGLRRQHDRAIEVTDEQPPRGEGVAAADHLLARQTDHRPGALDLAERVDHLVGEPL